MTEEFTSTLKIVFDKRPQVFNSFRNPGSQLARWKQNFALRLASVFGEPSAASHSSLLFCFYRVCS